MKYLNLILNSIVFVSIMAANFSYADQTLDERSCTFKDVSAPLGKLRTQGNIGWCYANVAADLLTFRYQKELQGQQASAGYVAITFNQYTKSRPNEDAGLISPSLVFSQLNGICPQQFQENALANSPFKTIREQINALVQLKLEYNQRKKEGVLSQRWELLEAYRKSGSYLNTIPVAELMLILDKSTVRNFPRQLAARLCKKYLVKVKLDLQVRFQVGFVEGWLNVFPNFLLGQRPESPKKLGQAELISEVHEQLNRDNMVAISYDTRIFYDAEKAAKKKPGLHASSIVGRQWRDGHCELKLRNSVGTYCGLYTNPDLKDKCEASTGYVWIPDYLLQQTISDIAYYKK